MTIEASLVGKSKETIRQANKIIRKKKCTKTKRIHRPEISISLQKLFIACKDMFKGPGIVPPSPDVQRLQRILDNMEPEDFGLSSNLVFFNPRSAIKGTPSIKYTTIYQCKNFSLCIFFLPPTAVIPLHNHPEMTVFSKLLLGSMHIKSYDLVNSVTSDELTQSSKLRLARMKADNVFTAPCNTSVLYPTSGGNIHAFTAVTACAVLDVLGPPYSKDDGRDCTYYRDFPYSSSSNAMMAKADGNDDASYGWLEEIDVPKELRMDRVDYMGPQIVETNC
ncbi:plant cysteine oxidase 2-like [Thalictrum thalictroides]|uniref:cysteine dioxygenase n=1 Tax=Thalictrum thalictroides TaxID=46969 RepID=A0A7J6VSZ3_THATH|nr:plant cysteine oxidase 2-like [Thalictrum thalictroides]